MFWRREAFPPEVRDLLHQPHLWIDSWEMSGATDSQAGLRRWNAPAGGFITALLALLLSKVSITKYISFLKMQSFISFLFYVIYKSVPGKKKLGTALMGHNVGCANE